MFNFRSQLAQVKRLFFILCFSLLTSCAINGTKEEKIKNEPVSQSTKEGASEVNNVGKESLTQNNFVNAVDPMGDIQINSEIAGVYKRTADLIKSKQLKQAINGLIKIKAKYPQLSGPNYQIARIYLIQKNYQKALEQVEESLFKNGRNYYAMNLKGIIFKSMGKFSDAKASYLKAIEVYPNYSKSHLNLGVLADLYLGNTTLALQEYRQYMELTSGQDKKVEQWIVEVERRIKATN